MGRVAQRKLNSNSLHAAKRGTPGGNQANRRNGAPSRHSWPNRPSRTRASGGAYGTENNDISGDVVTFFRVLQEHYPYFIDMLRWRITSRNEFERLKGLDPERLTDLQRAARFLYMQRLAFGGKVAGRSFGVDRASPARFSVTKLEPVLAEIHERLTDVTIEQLSFSDFIRRYDRVGMFFYCDPPYFGCEDDYGEDVFAPVDFERLADAVRGAACKVLVSINDHPQSREIFSGLHQAEVEGNYILDSRKRIG